jgi:Predicted transcriptional regulator
MSDDVTTYECSHCGNLGIGDGPITCCEETMGAIEDDPVSSNPTLSDLLKSVFEMSDTELELCLCVMEGGSITVSTLAEQTEYDRSLINRHLNHLASIGVVTKQRRLLNSGGEIYVYTPVSPETVREQLRGEFSRWTAAATTQLNALQREKVESIADPDDDEGDPAWEVFYSE